jgi:hypothetical protein
MKKKSPDSSSLKLESTKKEKWIIPKNKDDQNDTPIKDTKFLKFLRALTEDDIEMYELAKKIIPNIIKIKKGVDYFVYVDDGLYETLKHKFLWDEWVVRDKNVYKYTKKMIEKYGDKACIYIFEPDKDYYLIRINDNFTPQDFKTLYKYMITNTLTGEDVDNSFGHSEYELEGVSHYCWYNIGGVELEKTEYNNFEGNIYISDRAQLKLLNTIKGMGKK